MTPHERSKDCVGWCKELDRGACRQCVENAIIAAIEEERVAIISIIAGGDRPWQELADTIRARGSNAT